MAAAVHHAPGNAASHIRLFIECHNLLDKDTFSKSDPFCCIRLKNADQPAFQDIGRTEVRATITPYYLPYHKRISMTEL
jgi:hypothetical protein